MFTAIVRFSIKKKLFVGLTTLFLFIGGIYAMLTLPIDAVPDITNNQVQIVTVSPTLAPQEVEQLITMPIEIAMSNIMNVEDIPSTLSPSMQFCKFRTIICCNTFKDQAEIRDFSF